MAPDVLLSLFACSSSFSLVLLLFILSACQSHLSLLLPCYWTFISLLRQPGVSDSTVTQFHTVEQMQCKQKLHNWREYSSIVWFLHSLVNWINCSLQTLCWVLQENLLRGFCLVWNLGSETWYVCITEMLSTMSVNWKGRIATRYWNKIGLSLGYLRCGRLNITFQRTGRRYNYQVPSNLSL